MSNQSTKRNCRLIGIISDTHGLVRPEAIAALRGVDLIIHAGDIGSQKVLEELRGLAPVVAIRGNVDREPWASALPETEVIEVNGIFIYVLHNVKDLDLDPEAAGFKIVISGHSHKPSIEHRGDVLFLNPGSAGPRRFKLPISLARLRAEGRSLNAEIVELGMQAV
jgi:uncharacterized protein